MKKILFSVALFLGICAPISAQTINLADVKPDDFMLVTTNDATVDTFVVFHADKDIVSSQQKSTGRYLWLTRGAHQVVSSGSDRFSLDFDATPYVPTISGCNCGAQIAREVRPATTTTTPSGFILFLDSGVWSDFSGEIAKIEHHTKG